MKALIVLTALLLAAFVYTGCQDSNLGINLSVMEPDGNIVSFTGYADGYTDMVAWHPYARHFEGTGVTSLVEGECSAVLDYFMTSMSGASGTSGLGTGVLTLPNSSKMQVVNFGGTFEIISGIVYATASADIAGGTGEFNNVTGTINFTVTLNGATRETHAEWTGSYKRSKPFSGSFTAINGTVNNPSCDAGYIRRHAEGNGYALHFGNSTAWLEHCFSMTTLWVKDGVGVMKSAEGDEMNVVYSGYVQPIPSNPGFVDVYLLCKVTGGTGKFVNASGAYLFKAVQNMATGESSGTLDGAIDY